MARLFHRTICLSIAALAGAAAIVFTPVQAKSPAAPTGTDRYYGRWVVSDDRPVFTVRGRLYKTIDIAPCGGDFCGVSVGERGACGITLFRFHRRGADFDETLRGHAAWGTERKGMTLDLYAGDGRPGSRSISLALGDGFDFSERSGNMPKFHAQYRAAGLPRCTAR